MSLPTQQTPMAAYDGPTSLANQLHGYPHYDFARHQVEVSPQSVIGNPGPYLQSLGSIAALPIILFFIFFIFDLIIRIYLSCRGPRLDPDSASYKPRMYVCCSRYQPYWDRKWIIAMIIGTMCIITVFVALGFLGSVNKDLDKAENAMYDARGYQNNILQDGYDAIAIINSALNILSQLGAPDFNNVGPFQATLQDINGKVNTAASTLGTYIGTSQSYRFADDLIHYTDMGRNDLRAVMIAVFLLFFFTFLPLLLIRSFFPTKRTCINVFQIFALISCLIAWAAAMVMIAISVGVADLCQDPNAYLSYYFRNSSPDTQLTLQYYINCPLASQTASPLYKNLANAQSQTQAVDAALAQVRSQFNSAGQYKDLLQQIDTTNQQANTLLGNVIVDTTCTRLYNDYTIAVNTICKDTLSHWYGVAVCIALSTLFYVVMRCFIRSRQRIVSGDVEGDGNMVFTKVETPPHQQQQQHVIDMNQPQIQPSAPMEMNQMIIAPTSFEQPLAPAPSTTFQQPLEPARTTFEQPLAPAPATTDGPLVPPHRVSASASAPAPAPATTDGALVPPHRVSASVSAAASAPPYESSV